MDRPPLTIMRLDLVITAEMELVTTVVLRVTAGVTAGEAMAEVTGAVVAMAGAGMDDESYSPGGLGYLSARDDSEMAN